ncbi:MAG: glycosyltransferase family 2 protein [Candidatus Gracilibacteria bacterium]
MTNKPKISVIIVHYNTPHFLKTCLNAIFGQTYENIEVIFIDNNSPDKDGLEFVKNTYSNNAEIRNNKPLIVIDNAENLGYAKAANQGIKLAMKNDADFLVITNPDIIYTPEYFEKIIERIEKDPSIASITGKVYKYDFANQKPTNIIDTVGLFAYKNRRVIDDGQGVEDIGQFDEEQEVFGISGACPLYRKNALVDVKIGDEYLDENFFMYKEDVDLSWRFLLFGWKNLFYPKAIAYHGRGTGVMRRFTSKEVMENRKNLSEFQKKYSFRNQLLMEIKNELPGNFFKDIFQILGRKILMFGYMTIFEPYLWGSFYGFLKLLPSTLKKRAEIMKRKKSSSKHMSKYFGNKSKYEK